MRGFVYWSAYNWVVETVRADSAPGRVSSGDPSACGNALAKASREARADPSQLMLAARQYLASAGCARTCALSCSEPGWSEQGLGFSARRDGDFLHVTRADDEDGLAVGMRVAAAGGCLVGDLVREMGADVFGGRGTDREDWDLALRMFDRIDVFPGDGGVRRLHLRRFPRHDAARKCFVDVPAPGAVRIAVGSLADPEAVARAVTDARAAVSDGGVAERGARRLIVDLRGCAGQADPGALAALLPPLVEGDRDAESVMGPRRVWTNYSQRNVALLTRELEAAARGAGDEDVRAALRDAAAQVALKGEQVLSAKRATLDQQLRRAASELPEDVPSPLAGMGTVVRDEAFPADAVLLLDEETGAGAERLALAVRGNGRVRTVGRMTSGEGDYDGYLRAEFPDARVALTYPVSRSQENHDGAGLARTGVPLDVHVPFTAKECSRDQVLAAALELA